MRSSRAACARTAVVVVALVALIAVPTVAQGATLKAWSPTGSMLDRRAGHSATLLPDGSVLVLGDDLAQAERYDPATATWSSAGEMSMRRDNPTATLLRDGTVLVAGGSNSSTGSILASAERYDPDANAWTPVASMSEARAAHGAALLSDGRVLVAGGRSFDQNFATAELYDPATDAWAPAAAMASARDGVLLHVLGDGTVLAVGGRDAAHEPVATAELYDPATDSWRPSGSMAQVRASATAAELPDGTLLVAGGTESSQIVERFDPGSGAWSSVASPAALHSGSRLTALANGMALLTGGPAREAELYDHRNNTWWPAGVASIGREFHTSTLLRDGSVLVTGGWAAETVVASAERFMPVAGSDAPPIDFGDRTLDRTSVLTASLRNTADTVLFVSATNIRGAAAGDFSISHDRCTGAVLPGESCTVGLRFKPTALGTRAATLSFSDNTPAGTSSYPVTGVGVAASVGPRGRPASAIPNLRCKRGKARRMTCRGLPAKATSSRVRVKLTRAGKVYATGHLRRGRLVLRTKRRVARQRYTLRIGRRGAWSMVVRVLS